MNKIYRAATVAAAVVIASPIGMALAGGGGSAYDGPGGDGGSFIFQVVGRLFGKLLGLL
jgi:hypothetical protein